MDAEELRGALVEEALAVALFVPVGVVEDDEGVGGFGDPVEEGGEAELLGVGGELLEFGHEAGGVAGGEVVEAEVELDATEGDAPLNADGGFAALGEDAEEEGGFDGVVIGEGDERVEAEVFELAALDSEGLAGAEGRGPPGVGVVEGPAVEAVVAGLVAAEHGGEGRAGRGEARDEVEGFAGVRGVGVQGDAGPEGVHGAGAPGGNDLGSGHRASESSLAGEVCTEMPRR